MEPDIRKLLALTRDMPAYRELLDSLGQPGDGSWVVVLDAAKPYLIASLYQDLERPLFVITAQPEEAKKLYEQVAVWLNPAKLRLFPEPDALPYQRITSDITTELDRLEVLSVLANVGGEKSPPLVITSIPALVQKVVAYSDFSAAGHTIVPGQEIAPLSLLGRWEALGYRMENLVEVPGMVSRRGGVVDIYPPPSELPARLEFYGDTIDSIRFFDPATQRSLTEAQSLIVTPASEMLALRLRDRVELEQALGSLDLSGCRPEVRDQFQQEIAMLLSGQKPEHFSSYASLFNRDSVLSYLSPDTLLILNVPCSLSATAEDFDAKAGELRNERLKQGELPSNFPRPYFTWDELEPQLRKRRQLSFISWSAHANEKSPQLSFTPAAGYAGQLLELMKKGKKLLGRGHRLIMVSHQASRLSELLDEESIIAPPLSEIKELPTPGSLTLVQGSLAEGWVMNGDTHLLTDYEIFGFIKERRVVKRHPVARQKLHVELADGDYVVHIEHGIARFTGVTTLDAADMEKEYLVLQYAAGDKLYVPTDQIHRVSRYVGASEQPPALSRLGTQEWTRSKQRAKDAAEEVAQELLALYATREVVPGFAFSPDTVWQQELEASFPYVETPDQVTVQEQVKEDMLRARPMDRLVCGDVGYGKTEIAIRAAFKAVLDGKQVAVLVPTTVLAQQHFATFRQRLSAFPLSIEVLSRFKTPKEQSLILEGLANGSVDICIGTHRLLQRDVVFKDLGLLVIDEEQRFGVVHKEHLKRMRREVDVLTLSATPIPRTLHMSLVGVRDMSTIETPPEDRLPIKSYVAEYDDSLVREAILRELERNGQVFFVHNRVQTVAGVADKLAALVSEARVAIAHGQMAEGELEAVMSEFARGETDILVCTTIIESGLDMPNVNTLIVNKADKFGLTQLYQLRGRVGRGANLAYAYFLYDRGKHLTHTAERRLRTIFEASELGAGFNIAIRDLEIRGAGSLLGTKQSGHISAVGFNLYCRLLAEAVEREKARRSGVIEKVTTPASLPPPTIDLPLAAYIPESYVSDLSTRLSLYQRLAGVKETGAVMDFASEFGDRFGKPPAAVGNLLYAIKIKLLATKAGVESITSEHGQLVLRAFPGMHFDKEKLATLARDGVKIGLNQIQISYKRLGKEWPKVLEGVLGVA